MIRMLAMAGGIVTAVAASQFPEFSQQYIQRLSGAVNELRAVALAFDVSATAAGMTREEALASMGTEGFQGNLRADLAERITRYERLNADYQVLAGVDPLTRLANFWHFRDVDLAQETWDEFRPAVPVTTDGFIIAGGGFVLGWALVGGLLSLLTRPFRRRRYA